MISLIDLDRKKVLLLFGLCLIISWILIVIIAQSSPQSSTKNNLQPDSHVAGIEVTSIPTVTQLILPTILTTLTPTIPVSSTMSIPNLEYVKVEKVIDGDTVKLTDGRVVRYIGIDTPETVDPRKPVQCFAKEASQKNKELVEGKTVGLEKDISEKDKYGRILRYIYLDGVFINELLVKEGYASSYSYPPDIKYQNLLLAAERQARQNNLGLWGPVCTTANPSPTPIKTTHQTALPKSLPGIYECNCNKTCSKMTCDEAQYQLSVCGCQSRDADGDGVACDAQCQ